MAVKAHATISRLLKLHLYRCLVPTWVSATIVPHLYTYVRMMSVAQTLDSCMASDKQQLTRALEYKQNHNTLNNKLLFKYTRLSLVLADILNVSFSPSYGLEIIIPLSLKWFTKRETYSDTQGGNSELECGPKTGVMCKVKAGFRCNIQFKKTAPAGPEETEAWLRKSSSSSQRGNFMVGDSSGLLALACRTTSSCPCSWLPVVSKGHPKTRLRTPAHFHLLRYLHQPHLLVWDGTAASYACEVGIRSSREPRPRCGYWEELAAI